MLKDYSKLALPFLVLLLASILLLVLLLFKLTLDKESNSEAYLKYLTSRGEMIMGTNPTFPPMEYLDKKGRPIGFDIDFGTRIADTMGLEAEFTTLTDDGASDHKPSEKLLTALEDKKIDVIISSVIPTDELTHRFNTSTAYLEADMLDPDKKGLHFVIVLRRHEPELVRKINLVITNLQSTGVIESLKKKWFGKN